MDGTSTMIEHCRTAGRSLVFVPALFNDRTFESALDAARRRGCRVEYALALHDARETYHLLAELRSLN